MLLLALYKSYVSPLGVSIFYPNGRKVELVFVRRRCNCIYCLTASRTHTNVLEGNPLRGISLVRKRLKALYELSNVLQAFVYCVHKTDYAC